MKWLITGANGFIGRNLLRHLLETEDDTSCVVMQRHPHQYSHPRLKYVEADLSSDFASSLDHLKVNGVLFLAQSSRFREFPAGAEDMFRVNTEAAARLAFWAANTGVSRFIYASTGSVYVPGEGLLKESSPVAAASYYAASKLAAEHLLTPYGAILKVDILRIFNPYGPDQKNMLIPGLIERIGKKEPVTLNGGKGMVLRPLYISDLTEIIKRLMKQDAGKGCDVYNLGGSETTHLGEIADFVASTLGVELTKIEPEGSAPLTLAADSDKIYKLTHYFPLVHWKDGIKKCLQ